MRFAITASAFILVGSSIIGIITKEAHCFTMTPRFFAPKRAELTFMPSSSSVTTTKVEMARSSSGCLDLSWLLATAIALGTVSSCTIALPPEPCWAATAASDGGATSAANAKITTGGASTLQSGRTIAITRGVNLDNSDFHGQNLKGVAFQQSIVRDTNFEGCNLVGASFFDATVDGSNFKDADMTQANIEMAQFDRASLHNTIMKEVYVSGATLFEGVKDIEGSDWTDTYLRKDQQKYLCNHPTAKGTNPVTGVDTRESLMCRD